jgi:hypothetical protein
MLSKRIIAVARSRSAFARHALASGVSRTWYGFSSHSSTKIAQVSLRHQASHCLASNARAISRLASLARSVHDVIPIAADHNNGAINSVAETVKVPQMAESISEGTLRSWSKQVGDTVEVDEEVATIETDKVRLQ